MCSTNQLAASASCHASSVLNGSVRIECRLQLHNFGAVEHSHFMSVSDTYAQPLGLAAFHAAHALGLVHSALAEGAYAWVSRLTDKMCREVALLAAVGATIVGMSMVLEVMVACNERIIVLVLSLVINMIIGVFPGMGEIEKATMESMDKGSSAEIVLLLRANAGMGNDNKRDMGEGEIVSGHTCETVLLLEVE